MPTREGRGLWNRGVGHVRLFSPPSLSDESNAPGTNVQSRPTLRIARAAHLSPVPPSPATKKTTPLHRASPELLAQPGCLSQHLEKRRPHSPKFRTPRCGPCRSAPENQVYSTVDETRHLHLLAVKLSGSGDFLTRRLTHFETARLLVGWRT